MKIFAIGDLHLSFDPRVDKPMDVFGPEWKNHAERVRESWLNTVGEQDTVLIPGDISWGLKADEAAMDLAWVHSLPGEKILSKGNHDLWWTSAHKLNGLYGDMHFLQNTAFPIGDGIFAAGTRGWTCPGSEGFTEHDEKIYHREVLRLRMSLDDAVKQGAEEIIAMLHYPPTNEAGQGSDFTKALREYGVKTCVYGHLHGERNFRRGIQGYFNGVDYHLVSLDHLMAMPLRIR
ncbi:MAG: metallophosphoesterase [Eubacteriales bacterium]|nr:metallophosphoesterase [Eubacteriales bacterium]